MTGYRLLEDAILRVMRNFNEALAISGLIWIGVVALQVVVTEMLLSATPGDEVVSLTGGQALFVFIANILMLGASLWVAVEWHQFVLEGKRPQTVLPSFDGARVWSYFVRSIQIGLIVVFMAFLLGFLVTAVLGSVLQVLGYIFLTGIIGLPILYVFYRISPVLPAAALGERTSFAEAWNMTKPHGGPIIQAAILGILGVMALQIPAMLFGTGLLGTLYNLASGWVVLMVGVSLLSSIYKLCNWGEL